MSWSEVSVRQIAGTAASLLAFGALSLSQALAPQVPALEGKKKYLDAVEGRDPRIVVLDLTDKEEVMELATRSFSGTRERDPEGGIQWMCGPILREEFGDPKREAIFRFCIKWLYISCAYHGVVFGLRCPKTGQLEAVMMTRHPASMRNGETHTVWQFMMSMMRCGLPPWIDSKVYGTTVERRGDQFQKCIPEMHKQMVPGDHWYLSLLAVSPESQGKGAGGALLRHLNAIADKDNVPIFLETQGERNAAIYRGKGYVVSEQRDLKEEGETVTITGMLRPPQAGLK